MFTRVYYRRSRLQSMTFTLISFTSMLALVSLVSAEPPKSADKTVGISKPTNKSISKSVGKSVGKSAGKPVQAEQRKGERDCKLPPCDPHDEECRTKRLGDDGVSWLTSATPKILLEKLGKPKTKGEREEWAATGDFAENWSWPEAGVHVTIGAPNMTAPPNHVIDYQVSAPFKGKTKRGIGIGSTHAEVRAAYSGMIDEDASSATYLVAGSRFGGVMFNFTAGTVSQIFVGATAE